MSLSLIFMRSDIQVFTNEKQATRDLSILRNYAQQGIKSIYYVKPLQMMVEKLAPANVKAVSSIRYLDNKSQFAILCNVIVYGRIVTIEWIEKESDANETCYKAINWNAIEDVIDKIDLGRKTDEQILVGYAYYPFVERLGWLRRSYQQRKRPGKSKD